MRRRRKSAFSIGKPHKRDKRKGRGSSAQTGRYMSENKFKNVLFDLDGTVLDTLPDLVESANYALVALGYPAQTYEQVRRAIGRGIRNLLKDLMHCEDVAVLEKCRLIFKGYYDAHKAVHTKPYEGMTELVRSLKERGIKVFVISNKYDDAAKDLVYAFYGDLFDGVYGSTDDMPPKPDRAVFDKVCREHSLSADECVYVGDSEVDIRFAANCGMKLAAVSWGFRTREELMLAGAEECSSDTAQLRRKLEELTV